jgi:hypothetical protein
MNLLELSDIAWLAGFYAAGKSSFSPRVCLRYPQTYLHDAFFYSSA